MKDKYSKERIGFWLSDYGAIVTHHKGLTKKDIEMLKSVKEGDRLIIFDNVDKNDNTSPDCSMKIYFKKEEDRS